MSNFSFTHSVFYPFRELSAIFIKFKIVVNCFNLDQSKIVSSGNGLNPHKPCFFTCLQYKSFENTGGKGEIAHYEQFLLFPIRFLPILENFLPFSLSLSANSSGWKSLKLSFGKGLKKILIINVLFILGSIEIRCRSNGFAICAPFSPITCRKIPYSLAKSECNTTIVWLNHIASPFPNNKF